MGVGRWGLSIGMLTHRGRGGGGRSGGGVAIGWPYSCLSLSPPRNKLHNATGRPIYTQQINYFLDAFNGLYFYKRFVKIFFSCFISVLEPIFVEFLEVTHMFDIFWCFKCFCDQSFDVFSPSLPHICLPSSMGPIMHFLCKLFILRIKFILINTS